MVRKTLLGLLFSVVICSALSAQPWATKMFTTTSHNFGPIARGAKAEFEYALSNIYLEDVHIASVRSSCGCTKVRIEKAGLKTYEKGAIVATINSDAFLGQRGATVTVTFDKPFPAQVRLQTKVYIRSDVVFHPRSVQIGEAEQGVAVQKKVSISYAGRSDWKILEVKSPNPYVSGKVVETRRSPGRVGYDLLVHLDERAPPGYIRDHLVLVTNDRRLTQVPIMVEGIVQSGISVSPASLFLGVVEPGQKVTKQIVVRSKRPFRILSIHCDDESFEFGPLAAGPAKPLHLIPVTFMAGDARGKVLRMIRIETDLGQSAPELLAYAVVVAD